MGRLHDRMDFDVDFRWLSSPTGKMSWKTSYRFAGSILWADISAFEITFIHRSYQRCSDMLWAQLSKSTYSNSCVWPAGLAMRYFINFGLENSFRGFDECLN